MCFTYFHSKKQNTEQCCCKGKLHCQCPSFRVVDEYPNTQLKEGSALFPSAERKSANTFTGQNYETG
jgi:hypothetical protein